MAGIDDLLEENEKTEDKKVIEMPKRKAFHTWTVKGTDYRMKLTTSMISKLEERFGNTNLLMIVSDLPPLKTMLTIAQAAMAPWNHGIKYSDVEGIFDNYVEEGGNQIAFYKDHLMECMNVSGFFTENQAETMKKAMEDMDQI